MDYSSYYNAPQNYQFLNLPPTPIHAESAGSVDDFRNPQSDVYDQFQTFDFNPQFSSSNIPPHKSSAPVQHLQHQKLQKAHQPLQHKDSISSNGHAAATNGFEVNKFEANTYATETTPEDNRSAGLQGSNSDDDDMTPAQSRRKAQNRAAQRAFRERKERHVKDLETKLLDLENASKNLMTENERLKLQLQKASTENEILKATSSSHNRSPSPPTTSGPMHFSPTDFYTEVLESHDNKVPSHRVVFGDDGGKLLAAGAAWDFIISHPLFLRGMVDVGDVSERLKSQARCDGQGPVFSESDIVKAIEASFAHGSDELL